VQEGCARYVINPRRPSATANIGLGNQNFFATCHAQYFSPRSVVDNAADGALRLQIARPGVPDPTARERVLAGLHMGSTAVSTSFRVAKSSLASSDQNTSGGSDTSSSRSAVLHEAGIAAPEMMLQAQPSTKATVSPEK